MRSEPALAFFKGEFEAEEAAGFPRVLRIPDTHSRHFVHYFRGLPKPEALLLKAFLVKRTVQSFLADAKTVQFTKPESAAWERFRHESVRRMSQYQFVSLKLLKMAAGDRRKQTLTKSKDGISVDLPAEIITWLERIKICKPADLRQQVQDACDLQYGFVAKRRPGGYWVYEPEDGTGQFEIKVYYGGQLAEQLCYSVTLKPQPDQPPIHGFLYERLFGAGLGHWDFITEASAEQDVALLMDLIDYVVKIPARLAAKQ